MSDRINLIDTIAKNDMFSTFARMLRTSKANEMLSGEGTFTVFVPTNDAFGKIPDAQMNAWLSETDQTRLKSLLSYHIVPGKLSSTQVKDYFASQNCELLSDYVNSTTPMQYRCKCGNIWQPAGATCQTIFACLY